MFLIKNQGSKLISPFFSGAENHWKGKIRCIIKLNLSDSLFISKWEISLNPLSLN